jgi:hypothetical protein
MWYRPLDMDDLMDLLWSWQVERLEAALEKVAEARCETHQDGCGQLLYTHPEKVNAAMKEVADYLKKLAGQKQHVELSGHVPGCGLDAPKPGFYARVCSLFKELLGDLRIACDSASCITGCKLRAAGTTDCPYSGL